MKTIVPAPISGIHAIAAISGIHAIAYNSLFLADEATVVKRAIFFNGAGKGKQAVAAPYTRPKK